MGLFGYSPDCLLMVEREQESAVLDVQGRPRKEYVHMASERMPFQHAVEIQMRVNDRLNKEDERFDQKSKLKLLDQHGREIK